MMCIQGLIVSVQDLAKVHHNKTLFNSHVGSRRLSTSKRIEIPFLLSNYSLKGDFPQHFSRNNFIPRQGYLSADERTSRSSLAERYLVPCRFHGNAPRKGLAYPIQFSILANTGAFCIRRALIWRFKNGPRRSINPPDKRSEKAMYGHSDGGHHFP